MARSQSSQANTAVIRRAIATAQKDIERTERKFHQTIRSFSSRPVRAAQRSSTTTSRISDPTRYRADKPAPVQTAIMKVLSKRRRGLTMERLQEVLPQFEEKSLLNATFAMRRKGLVEFDRSGEGRGVYRWQD
jgi:ParB-like chromosome segregation protein Spo0J